MDKIWILTDGGKVFGIRYNGEKINLTIPFPIDELNQIIYALNRFQELGITRQTEKANEIIKQKPSKSEQTNPEDEPQEKKSRGRPKTLTTETEDRVANMLRKGTKYRDVIKELREEGIKIASSQIAKIVKDQGIKLSKGPRKEEPENKPQETENMIGSNENTQETEPTEARWLTIRQDICPRTGRTVSWGGGCSENGIICSALIASDTSSSKIQCREAKEPEP